MSEAQEALDQARLGIPVDRFLGRCQHCLDNAYAESRCPEISHYDCLINRVLKQQAESGAASKKIKEESND